MKNFLKDISITEIILLLALLVGLGFLIKHFISAYQDAQNLKGEKKLAGDTHLTKDGLSVTVKEVPKKDLQAVKKQLDNFDPKPIADMIYNAAGVFNDDEDAVYSAFSMLKSKAELSLLADYFQRLYKKSLFEYIQSFLNAEELSNVNDVVSKLPSYYV